MTQKEEPLVEGVERYRDIINNILDVIVEIDAKGKFVYLSPPVFDMFGFRPEELIELSAYEFIHPEDLSYFKKALDKALKLGDPLIVELKLLHKKGDYVLVSIKGRVVSHNSNIKIICVLRDITEPKKVEQKSNNILENIKEGYFEVNLKGNYTFVNDYMCKMLGYSKEEILGMSYNFVYEDKRSKEVYKLYNQLFKNEISPPLVFESQLLTQSGKILYYEALADLKYDSKGNKVGFFGLLRDITERKIAEHKLIESEIKYRNIIENAKEGYYETDLKGNFTFFNNALCELLKYSPEEAMGLHYKSFMDEENSKKIFKAFNEVYRTGVEQTQFQYEIVTKNAEHLFGETSISLKYDSDGRKIGFCGFLRDITEKKIAEQNLQQSEKKYREILENMQEGYFEVDLRGNLTFVNDYYCKLLGHSSKEEILGKSYRVFQDKETSDKLFKIYNQLYKNEIPSPVMLEREQLTPSGETIYYEALVSLKYNSEGKKVGFFGLMRDITERIEAEQKLKESEEKYRGILENIKEGYFESDLKGNLTFINDSYAKIFGYTREELLGKNLRFYFDENTSKEVFKLYNQLYKTEIPIPSDNFAKVITSKGKQLFLEGSGDLLYDSEGNKVGIFGLIRDITNRKEAEQKLKEFEIKYKGILENIMEGYYEMDLYGNFTFASDFYCKILGFSKEELLGKNARLIFDEKSMENYNKLFTQLYKTGISFPPTNIIEVSTTRGKKISFEGSADLIYDSEGKKIGFYGLARDVSERIHGEQILKDSEEKYRELLENMLEGYIEVNLKGNYTFVNDYFCKLMESTKEEILGKSHRFFFPEQKGKRIYKIFNKMYKNEIFSPTLFDTKRVNSRGKTTYYEALAGLKYDSDGKKVGFFTLTRDVSERKYAEQKLKESEHKLEGRVKELNCLYEISKIIEKLDVSFEEIIQETLELIPPACQFPEITCAKITYDENIYATKNFKETKWNLATHLFINEKLMNIEVYHLEEKSFVKEENNLINDIGQRLKIIFERKKVEEELRELSRLKSEFLRRASHELKTPLISIKGFSDLILSLYSAELNPDVIVKLKEINQGCERLKYLINDLLQASRLDATDLKPKIKKEDLSFLIKFCVNELRSLAETRKQSINLEIHDKIIAEFEKEEIYDVLSNLLTNAIKYTPPNGKINVKTEILEDSITILVKDNGIGFTDNEKQRIFKQFGKIERFGQGHDLGIDGTGLGLYISKKIVESHNGRMWMESEGINKGSTFYFSLPKLRES